MHDIAIDWTSVCLSVTHWYCVETTQPIVKLSSLLGSPHDSSFMRTKLFPEFQLEHPQRGHLMQGGRKKLQFPTNISL